MNATVAVVEHESVGPDTYAMIFDSPEEFEARPGQFVKLAATVGGEEYARFYTLSSTDTEDVFEVTVGIDPEESGEFSRHLANLSPGDELEMEGPYGDQYYDGEPRAVVLAGGPGVGPAVGTGERALAGGSDVAVVYRDDRPVHRERLNALRAAGADVAVIEGGSLTDAVADVLTGREGEQVFVYGFAEFVEDARDAVAVAGGDLDEAKVENFG